MADDKAAEAREIVAKRIICKAVDGNGYPIAPEWDNYDEIGQHDWETIEARIKGEVAGRYGVTDEVYFAAYEFLSQRADAE